MHGNEQRLLYSIQDLLVSVGGFLGLFIGLSLYDVVAVLVEKTIKIKRVKKLNKINKNVI